MSFLKSPFLIQKVLLNVAFKFNQQFSSIQENLVAILFMRVGATNADRNLQIKIGVIF